MEYVAHRAGNDPDTLRSAQGVADLIELDVHRSRGARTEVRHAKRLWPSRRLWDRWYLLPPGQEAKPLDEIMAAALPDTALWFDLKGLSTNLGDRLVEFAVADERSVVVSSKSWWLLGGLTGTPNLRTFRSAGNRLELALLLWLPSRARTDGVVVHRRLLTPRVVSRLTSRGPVFTWNVGDRETIEQLQRQGIAGVILDDLGLLTPPSSPGEGSE